MLAKAPAKLTNTGTDDAPVVTYVQQLLEQAVASRASDLHFEPYEHHYRVRMRIDGELREMASPHMALKDRLASRIKVMSRLDIAEKRLPQDGRMKLLLAEDLGPEDLRPLPRLALGFGVSVDF